MPGYGIEGWGALDFGLDSTPNSLMGFTQGVDLCLKWGEIIAQRIDANFSVSMIASTGPLLLTDQNKKDTPEEDHSPSRPWRREWKACWGWTWCHPHIVLAVQRVSPRAIGGRHLPDPINILQIEMVCIHLPVLLRYVFYVVNRYFIYLQ